MIYILLLWTFALPPLSHADGRGVYLKKLTRTQTVAQVDALERFQQDLKTNEAACRLQLQEDDIPSACFLALRRKQQWRLVQPEKSEAIGRQLDRLCQKAARQAVRKNMDISALSTGDLTLPCANAIKKARQIIQYRKSENLSEDDWSDF